LRLGLERVLDDKVAKLVANQLFDVCDAQGCQLAPLVLVCFLDTFLDDLASVFVSGQLFKVEQDVLVNLLLSLLWVQEGQDQLDHMVASDVHHHFQSSIALLESFYQQFASHGHLSALASAHCLCWCVHIALIDLFQQTLQRSRAVRVHADSAELKFYVVKNLFEILLACLLKEHLA
jgi:hypothetical protein